MIIANLTAEREDGAGSRSPKVVERLDVDASRLRRTARLRTAILTHADAIPDNVKRDLAPLIGNTIPKPEPMKLIVTGSIAFDYLMSFPGQVHRALPARAHASRVSSASSSTRWTSAAAAAGRTSPTRIALLGERPLPDGDGGAGLRRLQGVDGRGQHRHLAGEGDRRQVLRVVLLQHRPGQQPDRVVLYRRDGQCRRAVDAHGDRHQGRAGDHLAERSRRHGAVRGGVRGDGREVHLGSGPAVRAHGRLAAEERRHRRVHGDLQRLRVRADSPEDRA